MSLRHHLAPGLLLLVAATVFAGDLTVETDADTYLIGETVHITIANPTDHVVGCSSSPIYTITHVANGTCVFGCLGLPVIENLAAGAVEVYDHDTGAEPAGEYAIVVFEIWDGDTFPPPLAPTTTYTLLDPTANEAKIWGRVKMLYR